MVFLKDSALPLLVSGKLVLPQEETVPKGIVREVGSRPGYRRVGCPSHHLWLRAPGRGPRDYCCCPWHGWRLGRKVGSAEPWWGRLLGEAEPNAHAASLGQGGLPAFIAGHPRLFQVLLRMASHPGSRQDGVRWDPQRRRHWPQGPLAGADCRPSDFPLGAERGPDIALLLQRLH